MHAINRIRVMQIIDFALAELNDLSAYKDIDYSLYRDNKNSRNLV